MQRQIFNQKNQTKMGVTDKGRNPFFCGDDRTDISDYLEGSEKYGINGLPINDLEVKKMLEREKDAGLIFLSCGFPLMGYELIKDIKKLQEKPVDTRLIPYRHVPGKRGFFKKDGWKNLPQEDIDFLFRNWSEMLTFYFLLLPSHS